MALPCELLLHPELLTNEQILHVLNERHLRIPNLETMSRNDLLEVFHHYCVPYGQRRYRDSGRGRILNRNRQVSPESKPKSETFYNISTSKNVVYMDCDRLKPSPDVLSGQMKRIKLENRQTTTVHINIDVMNKRKVAMDTVPLAVDLPPAKRGRKPITWP